MWCELSVRIYLSLCLYLSIAASQMVLTSTQGQKHWHNIWTKDEIMCLALLIVCVAILLFIEEGQMHSFFNHCCSIATSKQCIFIVLQFWGQKSEMVLWIEGDLSAGPRGLWPSPAFRRRLYALEHCPALLSHQFQPLHPSLTLLHPSYSNTCNYVRAIQIILDNLISRLNLPIPVKSPLLCGNTWRHNGGVWGLRLKHAGEGSRKTSPSRATSESDPRPASSFPSSVWRQRLQVMTPCSEF